MTQMSLLGVRVVLSFALDIFEFDENEEKAKVKLPEGGKEECIEGDISTCPVECIHWEEK